MAILKTSFILKATVNKNDTFLFNYDCTSLEEALGTFFAEDYPEVIIDLEGSGRFPIDIIATPDEDGMVERIFHLEYDCCAFDHYFVKGWSYTSDEPGHRYMFNQFYKDIERKPEQKA